MVQFRRLILILVLVYHRRYCPCHAPVHPLSASLCFEGREARLRARSTTTPAIHLLLGCSVMHRFNVPRKSALLLD